MKNLKYLFALLFVLAAGQLAFAQLKYTGTVVDIVDGKTVVLELPTHNRLTTELQNIEVPEPEQALHQAVKDHLQQLLLGKNVEFLAKGMMSTKTVGQLFSGGVDISQQMLRDGAAWYAGGKQDSADSQNYQKIEAQAKAEKLGVWSIANLKPAWEFRAEKEKLSKPQPVAETPKDDSYVSPDGLTTRARNFLRQQAAIGTDLTANYSQGMWSDVNYEAAGESKNSVGLLSKYETAYNVGYTATPALELTGVADKNLLKAVCRVGYFYRGASLQPGNDAYLFGVWAESKDWAFLKDNDLTVMADGHAFSLGKAKRFFHQGDKSVQELLIYQVRRSILQKIADSKTISLKVGTYSSPISQKSQNFINTLLVSSQ